MTTRQVRLFTVYVNCGLDIEATARAIGISVKGVESDLHHIRQEVQADLVVKAEVNRYKRSRGTSLTPAGHKLFEYCDIILMALDRIDKELRILSPLTPRAIKQQTES